MEVDSVRSGHQGSLYVSQPGLLITNQPNTWLRQLEAVETDTMNDPSAECFFLLIYLSDHGPGDDVGVVVVGVDAVHVLVQDGDLLLVVPASRTVSKGNQVRIEWMLQF